jgi:hypothetical protein
MQKSCCLLAILALSVGCTSATDSNRPKTYPASGTVTLNGSPVEGATVNFYAMEGTGSSIGVTDANGKYTLTTFTSNDGAMAGQYKVSIVKYDGAPPPTATTLPAGQLASGDIDVSSYAPPKESGAPSAAAAAGPKNLIPAKYSSADTSGLRGMISEGGSNDNNFDLK